MFVYKVLIFFAILPICQAAARDTHRRSRTSHNTNSILRHKRSEPCRYWQEEFRCNDGTCVTAHRKCDGVIDCPDGTDETHYLCRDNRSQFRCNDGNFIELRLQCDGTFHCGDGSDETSVACARVTCPANLFQCAYGACIDSKALCNNTVECPDGSDESDVLCNRKERKPIITRSNTISSKENLYPNLCELPPHPKNGMYIQNGASPIYQSGTLVKDFYLNVTCQPGYKVVGGNLVICLDGILSPNKLPTCVRACKLEQSPSVEYRCLITETGVEGTRDCDEMEVEGTVVIPKCSTPNYYSSIALSNMCCVNGRWSYHPKCEPECGTLTPRAEPLVVGGKVSERGEIPWHAGIYKKIFFGHHQYYQQICGGSLISRNVIISAAHCFWQEGRKGNRKLPEEIFAAAVGKLYREWNHPNDEQFVQKSQVKKIILAPRFYGSELNYQNDLAVVIVKHSFTYKPYIRPLCLDFSVPFYDNHRRHGDLGIVSGFGLTENHMGSESPILKVVNMPYVPFEECLDKTPFENAEYITNDKFCAGFGNGTSVCKGDSGGGWAYAIVIQGTLRYFLGGVVSTSPPSYDGSQCNIYTLTSFTDVYYHSRLIRRYWMP